MNNRVVIDANVLTDDMVRAGANELSKILCSLDVSGVWCDYDVIPDVFRAMVAVAPRLVCGCLRQPPEVQQPHRKFDGEPDSQSERRQ